MLHAARGFTRKDGELGWGQDADGDFATTGQSTSLLVRCEYQLQNGSMLLRDANVCW